MTNKLPPELTGKYPKKHGSRVLENSYRLSFAIYKDKGKLRRKFKEELTSLAPVLPPTKPGPYVPDVPRERIITSYGQDGFFPYDVDETPNEPDHTVDGFIYDRERVYISAVVDVTINMFTLFSGPEYLTIKVSKGLYERMQASLFVPMTYHEQVQSYVAGITPPVVALPIAQIAQIERVIASKCKLHIDCKGHFSEDSFRDNLR